MAGNPLAVKQRETKGAETFGKYDYQYHWALCRLLDQHHDSPEYAIFVEHHEDVVLADSLDAGKAKFEFNQIKCKSDTPFTIVTIVDKAGILADKVQLEKQAKGITTELKNTEKALAEYTARLDKLRAEIESINKKYTINDESGESHKLSNIVDSLASKAVQRNVNETKDVKQLDSKKAQDKQKELKKEQGLLLTEEQKNDRDDHFTSTLAQYIDLLDAQGINLDGVKSPLNHNKLIANGGAAESTRAILAYQMTVLNMAHRFGSSALSPFIIDTPNQHEQAKVNYESIIKLILKSAPEEQQVFLCALESPLLEPYRQKAHVIELDEEHKLLRKSMYDRVRNTLETAIAA